MLSEKSLICVLMRLTANNLQPGKYTIICYNPIRNYFYFYRFNSMSLIKYNLFMFPL